MTPKKRNKENAGLPARWRFRYNAYYYTPRPGERPYFDDKKEFRLGKTLHEAHEEFAQRIAKLTDPEGITTVDELADMYMTKAFPLKNPQSSGDIPRYVKTLRAFFKTSVIASIKTSHCYSLYEKLKETKGHNTANKHMEVLSDMLSHAIRWGLIDIHPMTGGKFKKTRPASTFRYIEDWELLEALKVAPPKIATYIELKWLTGLRRTDILSLTWNDVKEDRITVKGSKTGKAQDFMLNDELMECLAAIKALPCKIGSIYLFPNQKGQCQLNEKKKARGFEGTWGRWMSAAMKETKLEIRFQERQIRNKVSEDSETDIDASRRLGHASLSTTKRFYRSKPDVVTTLKRKK